MRHFTGTNGLLVQVMGLGGTCNRESEFGGLDWTTGLLEWKKDSGYPPLGLSGAS